MKQKNTLWFVLALAIVLSSAQFALAAQQSSSPRVTSPSPQNHDEGEKIAQRTITGPYRLTYTFKEMDGNKPVGFMHYTMTLDADAGRTTLKMGTKIPIVTGEYKGDGGSSRLDPVSYIDLGMNFQVELRQFSNGLELRSHIVESAVDTQQPNPTDPIIRQTDFENSVLMKEDKPLILGTVDMPGTTHVLQIQVELSRLH